jgi:hypothetical protein
MDTVVHASKVTGENLELELFSDDLILNYDPLVEHFKSRQEAFKRGNAFYTDIDYDADGKESVSVKETPDNKVFLVKLRVAAQTGKDGGPQVEERMILEFEKGGLNNHALIEQARKIWKQLN